MDLSFRFAPVRADFAVLLAGAAARAAGSATAAVQATVEAEDVARTQFDPADGRFNAEAARLLGEWKEG